MRIRQSFKAARRDRAKTFVKESKSPKTLGDLLEIKREIIRKFSISEQDASCIIEGFIN